MHSCSSALHRWDSWARLSEALRAAAWRSLYFRFKSCTLNSLICRILGLTILESYGNVCAHKLTTVSQDVSSMSTVNVSWSYEASLSKPEHKKTIQYYVVQSFYMFTAIIFYKHQIVLYLTLNGQTVCSSQEIKNKIVSHFSSWEHKVSEQWIYLLYFWTLFGF